MATLVAGKLYEDLDGQLHEIKRQIRQKGGYSFDPQLLRTHLQLAIEGKFNVGDFKIATASFDPTIFLGERWEIVPEEQDERSNALTEVDLAKVEFVSCLRGKEPSIKGEVKLSRLKEENRIRHGATVFMGLWQDYHNNKENSVLERLYKEKNITYMDFPGDILRDPVGDRHVLYLSRDSGGRWDWYVYWLDNDWDARHVSAVSLQVDS